MKKWKTSRTHLWENALFASIVHAVSTATYPEFHYEHSWEGNNYSTISDVGVRGTISFFDGNAVGVMKRDYFFEDDHKEPEEYLKGAPAHIIELAQKEAFQYVLENESGETKPVVDAAFWSIGEDVYGLLTEEDFQDETEELFNHLFLPISEAFAYWQEYTELTDEQMTLVHTLFERRCKNPDDAITLSEKEVVLIEWETEEGKMAAQESFAEINIHWR